ncbi:MAG: adenylate/guanylate cyclase domain-containing protein [Chloroflexota bacterium]
METGTAYIPMDWRQAYAAGQTLAEKQSGAALFADISGFTPLTEAFALELGPKRGGEELTRYLNQVYDDLIGVLHRYGGSVVSFSGDAITCWLDQDLDGRRAVRCALDMQAAIQALAEIQTPRGRRFTLGLKVAVTIGSVRRFVVGMPDYKLIDAMAGTTVERMATAEGVAERGDVIVDQATATALVDYLTVSEWREDKGQRFAVVTALDLAVSETTWPNPDELNIPQETISSWLLPAVDKRINSGLGEFLTEVRPSVALFVRFSGIEYETDPDAPEKLDRFVQSVQHIMLRLEGSLLQLTIGDKGSYLYATFGSPVAHEDDIERAVLAALALQEESGQLDFIDPLQIGISFGRMRTGGYGGLQRRTYGVLGDHVNLSARLMGKAPAGQIYVSENAHRQVVNAFSWEQLPPMQVKGKSEPITVFRVIGRKHAQTFQLNEANYKLPMVGRQAELRLIEEKIELVLKGYGQIVGITAEAGMGKTRLTVEAIRSSIDSGLAGFGGECQSFGTNSSYLVFADIFNNLLNIPAGVPPEELIQRLTDELSRIDSSLVPRIPLLESVINVDIPDNYLTASLDAKTKKSSLEGMLIDILRYHALQQPLLLVLEDSHWLDDLSKDFLEALGKVIGQLPILLLIAYRPPDTQRLQMPKIDELECFTEIKLSSFSAEESHALIQFKVDEFIGDQNIPARFVEELVRKASGNPFYLDEIINFIQDRGVDPTDENALLALDLPDTIYSLVLSRIDNLSETQKIAIRVASVIGRLFRATMVWGIYPAEEVTTMIMDDLERLSRLELTPIESTEPELTYIFKHMVTQEVAYESLPYQTRARLHEEIGYFIESRYPANVEQNIDLLAFHYGRSENLTKKKEFLRRAGATAQVNYANATAINYFSQLLPLVDGIDEIEVRLSLGEINEHVGVWDSANVQYVAAHKLAERLDNPLLLAKSNIALGEMQRKQGNYTEAEAWLTAARDTSELVNDRPGLAKAFTCLGTLNAQQGQLDESMGLYTRALDIRRELNDASEAGSILANMAIVAEYQGSLPKSKEFLTKSLENKRISGEKMPIAQVSSNLAYVLMELGEFDEVGGILEEALVTFRESGFKWWIANTLNNLGNVKAIFNEHDTAAVMYKESLEINAGLGEKWASAFLIEDISALLAQTDQPQKALTLVGAAERIREEIESPLSPVLKEKLDQKLAPAKEKLDEEVDGLLSAGQAMSFEQAVDFAASALM